MSKTPAIQNALQERDITDIYKQMSDLNNEIKLGFDGVHKRQDTANGKLLAHDTKLAVQEQKFVYQNLLWLVVTVLVGVVAKFIL